MRVRTVFSLLLPAVAACGGSGAPPAASPAGTSHAGASSGAAPESSEPAGPSTTRCDDGSCFSCGDGMCPSGFYCAVDHGHEGCAWIPKCASRSSCDCLAPVTKLDAACKCEERDGGVYVSCGG